MPMNHSGRLVIAGILACALSGLAPRPASAQLILEDGHKLAVTAVGCLEREKDYRHEHSLPHGGFLNTGKGDGDEYVLVDARIGGGSMDVAPVPEAELTCAGSNHGGQAFELSGHLEDELESLVGRRVVINGMLKHAKRDIDAVGTAGEFIPAPTSGGVNTSGADLGLREINVDNFRLAPALAPPEPAIAPVEPAPVPPEPAPAAPAPEPQAPPQAAAPDLPKTASPLPAIGISGLLLLAAGFGLRRFRTRLL